jgi:uncharacterized membrane protein YedE/YeeE
MMHDFAPLGGIVGGALIGAAAALLWLGLGRIAGISGILAALARARDRGWRLAFLAGLIAAPLLYGLAGGALPEPSITNAQPVLIVGGLLVGYGTRLGGGCTSGHGVCGLARLSLRSLVATCVFLGAAVVSVFVSRHLIGG